MSLKKLLLLVSLVLAALAGRANEIIFSRLSVSDGLRSNFVNCVWQDLKGFIWVGTESGLQRYDGNQFTQVYNESNHSLPALPVNQIVAGRDHRMWLRMSKTVGWYDLKTNTFHATNTSALPENAPILWVDQDGQVLITSVGEGVFAYNSKTNAFERWKRLAAVPRNWGTMAVFHDTLTGRYWVSGKAGLGVVDTKTGQFYTEQYNPLGIALLNKKLGIDILQLYIDQQRRYWVVKWAAPLPQTIYRFEEKSGAIAEVGTATEGYNEIWFMGQFGGALYIYGNSIFNAYQEESARFYQFYKDRSYGDEFKFGRVGQVFADRDRNLWIATDNGLYMAGATKENVQHGTLPPGMRSLEFVRQVSSGQLLVGNWGGGFMAYRTDPLRRDSALVNAVYRGLKPAMVSTYKALWELAENSLTHHLYFTCQAGGLIDYDPVRKQSKFINDTAAFKESTIRCVTEDRGHHLWFGSQSGKVVEGTPEDHFKLVLDLNCTIYKMLTDRRGLIWIGTDGKGVFVVDPLKKRIIQHYNQLSTRFIRNLVQVNEHLFAIAGVFGLDLLDTRSGHVEKFSVYNGLPQPSVLGLQMDRSGRLWLSTNNGISRYSFKTRSFRSFDQKDGLVTTTNEDNELRKSSMLSDGRLAFGGGNIFVIFDPDALEDAGAPKDVTITELKLFNQNLNVEAVEAEGGLHLEHDQNSVTIQFASLTYAQRDKLNYYYQLQGAGNEWVKAERSLTASYASLKPGHYTFLVKCVNPDGLAARHISSLPIEIRPAFWQTGWFMLLIVLVTAIPVYLIYRLRINRLLAVQELREKVARDLHDDMGSTLTSIGILSEMANSKLTGENPVAKDYLTRISTNSSQMMEAMDDIVWSINPSNDTMPKIIGRMREYAATILEPKNIDYVVVNDEALSGVKLDMERRRNLFLIYKEALNNLVKYAEASKVTIEFLTFQGSLQLVITDNGKGFDEQTVVFGNGLTNMRKRAEQMGGSLVVSSGPNGTCVTLKIPVT